MVDYQYFDRDISWLSFNERVLLEAAKDTVPLLERINFLSIYSSNLDEFYRVRIPALMALQKIKKEKADGNAEILHQATEKIKHQLRQFGTILTQRVIPLLKENGIHLIYQEHIPAVIKPATQEFFFAQLLAFLQPVELSKLSADFFPESNKLYILALIEHNDQERTVIVNIPSGNMSRFHHSDAGDVHYIVFIDDIIKENLPYIFPGAQ